MLVINSGATLKAGAAAEAPIREPRHRLYIRYEPDTKLIYISRAKFREYCARGQTSFARVLEVLTKQGVYVEDRKMRMAKGMQVSQPEAALVFSNEGDKLFGDGEVIVGNPRKTT
jgi:hypothetical protein